MTQTTKYDLFISYADTNRDWVKGYLLNALKEAGVSYHSEAAFALGKPKITEFENAIKQSNRTLLVISTAYLGDNFNQFIDLLAQHFGLNSGAWQVIPLILEPVELPSRLDMLVKLNATNSQERKEAIERLLQELQQPVPAVSSKPSCPYPGMIPFSEDKSHLFFGRDQLIEKFIQSLRKNQFIAAIGASGSGKSSLIFAGLMPKLQQSSLFGEGEWLVCEMRPGKAPLNALGIALKTDLAKLDDVVDRVLKTQPKAERLLLVIDQFEELFTLSLQDNILPFQESLLRLVKIPKCYVVITIRADFYGNLIASPLWQIAENNLLNVTPLDKEGLRQAITKPAETSDEFGVFVDQLLVERFVSEAAGEPGILPFIQETLVLLWEKLERRYLPLEAYENLKFTDDNIKVKGLQAAIAYHAKATLDKLSKSQQVIARRILLRLVQFGEGRDNTRRQQDIDALKNYNDDSHQFEETLRHLVENRLLTLSGEEDQRKRVDIAHEALINGWPTLKEWIKKRSQAEQERRRLENKAAEWIRLKRKAGLLDAEELSEAKKWQSSSDAVELGWSNELQEFINASQLEIQNAEKQKQANIKRTIGGLIAGLVIVSGFGIWAEYQRRLANYREKNNKSLQLATASESSLNIDTTRSLLLAIQANLTQETPQATYALWQAFQENHERFQLVGHKGKVTYAEFDPTKSNRILTVSDDKTARIWDLDRLDNPIVLKGHQSTVLHGTFAKKKSNRVLTVSSDGTANVWDLNKTDKPLIILRGHNGAVNYGTFAPTDDNRVLTVSSDRTARIWDISIPTTPKVLEVLKGHNADIFYGSFDPNNSNRILTVSSDSTARIWDLNKSNTPLILKGHTGAVLYGSFDPKNSDRVLTVSDDKTARVWNLSVPNSSIVLEGHQKAVLHGIFDPQNPSRVLTVSDDKTVRIWDSNNPKNPKILTGHQDSIHYISFNPKNPNQFLTVSSDKTTKIWDINSYNPLVTLYGHKEKVIFGTFHPNKDNRILTTSDDRTARIWDIGEKVYQELSGREGKVHRGIVSGIFNPENSNEVLTVARDGTLKNWIINNPKESKILPKKLGSIDYAQIDSKNPRRIATVNPTGLGKINTDKNERPLRTRGKVESISFDLKNPNRVLIVSGSTATVWNINNNIRINLSAPPYLMNQGEFDPNDSNRVATTGGADGIVRIWNLKSPTKPQKELTVSQKEIWHVSFDPKNSNRILVLGSDRLAKILNIQTGEETALTGHTNAVVYGSFDPNNSNRVLTVSHDGTARIWNIKNPGNPLILKGSKQKLIYGTFDPKTSNRVLTVSSNGNARIYIIGGRDLSESAWNRISRCFSHQEASDYNLAKLEPLKTLSTYLQKSTEILSSQKYRPYC
ncbi:MAG: TIR domain-containing protein [Rivularia sp. (in: Bacteria)]|nr:TIR domain-containing protein [Rivularia sp. MS3]